MLIKERPEEFSNDVPLFFYWLQICKKRFSRHPIFAIYSLLLYHKIINLHKKEVMERTFRSKIDKWYHLLIWGVLALVFYFFWHRQIGWALTMLIAGTFLLESLLRTEYVFTGDGYLAVKCGFFPRYRIPLNMLEEIRYIRSNRPAYALSSDRLLLITAYGSRMISPANREEFIKEVRKYNPHIQVTR